MGGLWEVLKLAMSYNVRFWEIRERLDRRKPFMVRWTVDGREKSESFMTFGLADSRRSKLMTAARDGVAFDVHTGLPASELRAIKQRTTWYDLAHEYLDQRWDRTPGTTRRTLADAFATITPALVRPGAAYPEPRVLRRALYSWAFNKNAWVQEPQEEWRKALDWMKRNSLPVGVLAEADVLRRGLDALCRKLDGTAAVAKTARRKRAAFSEVLNTAVERGYFAENPLNRLRWNAPAVNEEVDPAAVPNPAQAARLLAGVAQQRGRGPHLEAFFGCIYYAAMRPHGGHPPPARTVSSARIGLGAAQPVGWCRRRRQGLDGRRRGTRGALAQAPRGHRHPARAHSAAVRAHPAGAHRTVRRSAGRPIVPEPGLRITWTPPRMARRGRGRESPS